MRSSTTVEEETQLVRAGRLRDAGRLQEPKGDLARLYATDVLRLKASRRFLAQIAPDALADAATPPRRLPGAAADQSDRARDRSRGIGRHHPRRFRRTSAQGDAADLWRVGPRQHAGTQVGRAHGGQPLALIADTAWGSRRAGPPRAGAQFEFTTSPSAAGCEPSGRLGCRCLVKKDQTRASAIAMHVAVLKTAYSPGPTP